MTYLDSGATSFPKPRQVTEAMARAMETCGNPGRGGYEAAMRGAKVVLRCREKAGGTGNCSYGDGGRGGNCSCR